MKTDLIEKRFKSELLQGEEIRWRGRPQDYSLNSSPFGWRNALIWAFCLAFAGVLIYFMVIDFDGSLGSIFLYLICMLVPAMVGTRPTREKKELVKETGYALSNLRLINLADDSNRGDITRYLPISAITRVEAEPTGEGRATVYVNEACKVSLGRSRHKAVDGVTDGKLRCSGLILYNVMNWQALCEMLPVPYTLRPVADKAYAEQLRESKASI